MDGARRSRCPSSSLTTETLLAADTAKARMRLPFPAVKGPRRGAAGTVRATTEHFSDSPKMPISEVTWLPMKSQLPMIPPPSSSRLSRGHDATSSYAEPICRSRLASPHVGRWGMSRRRLLCLSTWPRRSSTSKDAPSSLVSGADLAGPVRLAFAKPPPPVSVHTSSRRSREEQPPPTSSSNRALNHPRRKTSPPG